MIISVTSTLTGLQQLDDGITEKQFDDFVKEINQVVDKYKIAFGGSDNGLYLYSTKTGFAICEDGDADFVGTELEVKKLKGEFSKEPE